MEQSLKYKAVPYSPEVHRKGGSHPPVNLQEQRCPTDEEHLPTVWEGSHGYCGEDHGVIQEIYRRNQLCLIYDFTLHQTRACLVS